MESCVREVSCRLLVLCLLFGEKSRERNDVCVDLLRLAAAAGSHYAYAIQPVFAVDDTKLVQVSLVYRRQGVNDSLVGSVERERKRRGYTTQWGVWRERERGGSIRLSGYQLVKRIPGYEVRTGYWWVKSVFV